MDGLTGSELRLLKRPSVAVPDSTGQGAWGTTYGTHDGADISVNTGISMYSIASGSLQGARRDGLSSFSGICRCRKRTVSLCLLNYFISLLKNGKSSVLCSWATSSEINNDYFEVYAARACRSLWLWENRICSVMVTPLSKAIIRL